MESQIEGGLTYHMMCLCLALLNSVMQFLDLLRCASCLLKNMFTETSRQIFLY
jgi:hypothetical protein